MEMKKSLCTILVVLLCVSCANRQNINVIPYPNHVDFRTGSFDVENAVVFCPSDLDSVTLKNVKSFSTKVKAEFSVSDASDIHHSKAIVFALDNDLPSEAYNIDVTRKKVQVEASDGRGFLYAIQTLLQMCPDIPCVRIDDSPRFAYRGLHLDEARHFFGKDFVKKYLDIMAFHKLNKFHWHLTDDQGWRVEILKYPELTSVGSRRDGTCIRRNYNTNDGVPYGEGMYYTQDDIREIVAYASERGIDIIPEIDLPGHMLAALAAYPHLGCTGGPYKVWHRWGVSKDVLCAGNDEIYLFLEDVLTEICNIFPYEYIHIGGDECPKDSWKRCPKCQKRIRQLGLQDDDDHRAEHYLQSYVMNRVESFLASKGRKVIGWDEILEGSVSQSATVMSWRGEKGGIKAAALGHDVIMTPNTYCYWDYYQSTDVGNEPFAIGGYIPVELVYSYEPYAESMDSLARTRILGVQANMWTEYILDSDHVEYMLLPRLAALSEVQWCMPDNKDWDRFLDGMDEICRRYEDMGYTFAPHVFNPYALLHTGEKSAIVSLSAQGGAPIRYTLDGSDPTVKSELYTKPIVIDSTCTLKASAERNGVMTHPHSQSFSFHKAVGRPLTLAHLSESKFSSKTGEGLVDGIRGPAIHKSKEWCSWSAKPFEAVIEMSGTEPYSNVEIGYFVNKPSQIFNPLSLTVSVSEDGEEYRQVAHVCYQPEGEADPDGLKSVAVSFEQTSAAYLKVSAECLSKVPEWHHYAGRKASLYIDEVIVQ